MADTDINDDDKGTEDDEDFDTQLPDDAETGDDKDDGDDGKTKYEPPSESEYRKMQRALKRANTQAKKLREEQDAKNDNADEETVQKAREDAQKETEGVWKPRYVKQAARAAFATAGLKGKPEKLLKLLDIDEIDIDEDGEIDGLDEQVRDLKREYPQLFDTRAPRDVDSGDKGKNKTGDVSSAEQIARALTAGRS